MPERLWIMQVKPSTVIEKSSIMKARLWIMVMKLSIMQVKLWIVVRKSYFTPESSSTRSEKLKSLIVFCLPATWESFYHVINSTWRNFNPMPSTSSPKAIADHLTNVSNAWKKYAAGASFGGMTLAQFQAKIKPSFDDRAKIAELEKDISDATNVRDDDDAVSTVAADLVVKGVVGDPNFGEDSTIYEAMGYVRKSERKTGLTRKSAAAAKVKAVK